MSNLAAHLVPGDWQSPATEPGWLTDALRNAWHQLEAKKLPTVRQEDWKYTSLELLAKRQFATRTQLPAADWVADQLSGLRGGLRLVFVDGFFAENHSVTRAAGNGLTIGPLNANLDAAGLETHIGAADIDAEPGFSLLATARFNDGVYIDLQDSCAIDIPVEIVHISTGDSVYHQRNVVRLGTCARLEVSEHYISTEGSTGLVNNHTAVELSANADLDWVRVQQHESAGFVVTRTQVSQRAASKFNYFGMDTGGRLVRHDIHSRLLESGAEVRLAGVTVIAGQQHVDNHTNIEHIAADCISRERFKAVAAGRSRVVFNGKIKVHPGADGTDSSQSNANLLLSAHAEVDTKPEMEIYADDVIAAHGATVGQLDETAVFYLRSRGLSELEARQLLIRGFCRELVDNVSDEQLREFIDDKLARALPGAGSA